MARESVWDFAVNRIANIGTVFAKGRQQEEENIYRRQARELQEDALEIQRQAAERQKKESLLEQTRYDRVSREADAAVEQRRILNEQLIGAGTDEDRQSALSQIAALPKVTRTGRDVSVSYDDLSLSAAYRINANEREFATGFPTHDAALAEWAKLPDDQRGRTIIRPGRQGGYSFYEAQTANQSRATAASAAQTEQRTANLINAETRMVLDRYNAGTPLLESDYAAVADLNRFRSADGTYDRAAINNYLAALTGETELQQNGESNRILLETYFPTAARSIMQIPPDNPDTADINERDVALSNYARFVRGANQLRKSFGEPRAIDSDMYKRLAAMGSVDLTDEQLQSVIANAPGWTIERARLTTAIYRGIDLDEEQDQVKKLYAEYVVGTLRANDAARGNAVARQTITTTTGPGGTTTQTHSYPLAASANTDMLVKQAGWLRNFYNRMNSAGSVIDAAGKRGLNREDTISALGDAGFSVSDATKYIDIYQNNIGLVNGLYDFLNLYREKNLSDPKELNDVVDGFEKIRSILNQYDPGLFTLDSVIVHPGAGTGATTNAAGTTTRTETTTTTPAGPAAVPIPFNQFQEMVTPPPSAPPVSQQARFGLSDVKTLQPQPGETTGRMFRTSPVPIPGAQGAFIQQAPLQDGGPSVYWYYVDPNTMEVPGVTVPSPAAPPAAAPAAPPAATAPAAPQRRTGVVVNVQPTHKLNIRANPNTTADIMGTAGPGVSFNIIGDSGDWYVVQLDDGRTGYVSRQFIREQGGSAPAAQPPSPATMKPVWDAIVRENPGMSEGDLRQVFMAAFSDAFGYSPSETLINSVIAGR